MVELIEVRELTIEEKNALRQVPKILKENLKWIINEANTVRIGHAEVWPQKPEQLPFKVQASMILVTKIIIPIEGLDYYYKLKSTGQIIRMYHNEPGHDDITQERINGSHKHYFEGKIKGAYPVHDIGNGAIRALKDFLIEENIAPLSAITPYHDETTLERWGDIY